MNLEPGLYPGVTNDCYQQWNAASAHRLSLLARSPAHLRWFLDHPEEPTPSLIVGGAFHALCLQPDVFGSQYAVAPECDRRTKEGKATWETFCAAAAGRTVIKEQDADLCTAMMVAVHKHPTAGELLRAPGPVEVSALWWHRLNDDPPMPQLCKLRADKLAPEHSSIVDLKTTDDASPDGFERSILKYGYHRQAAMYLHGMAALGTPYDHFVFVCVEKDAPHAVGVYRLDDEAVEAGWAECEELLAKYAECCRTNTWPGYPDDVQTISLPDWKMRQLSYGRIG
jgi:hypothetical protein